MQIETRQRNSSATHSANNLNALAVRSVQVSLLFYMPTILVNGVTAVPPKLLLPSASCSIICGCSARGAGYPPHAVRLCDPCVSPSRAVMKRRARLDTAGLSVCARMIPRCICWVLAAGSKVLQSFLSGAPKCRQRSSASFSNSLIHASARATFTSASV